MYLKCWNDFYKQLVREKSMIILMLEFATAIDILYIRGHPAPPWTAETWAGSRAREFIELPKLEHSETIKNDRQ